METTMTNWHDGVIIQRVNAVGEAMAGGASLSRATAFNFTGEGGSKTWIGRVAVAPTATTGGHHHGRHEVAVYVVKGQGEISWGERLEYSGRVGPGDFVYFAPHVPHQERNLDREETLDFVVVRSDNEPILSKVEIKAA
jgi:uncharacterized RmlC-like cupin family protein